MLLLGRKTIEVTYLGFRDAVFKLVEIFNSVCRPTNLNFKDRLVDILVGMTDCYPRGPGIGFRQGQEF